MCRPLASKQQKLPFVPADVFMNKICDWLLQKLFRLTFLTLSKGRQAVVPDISPHPPAMEELVSL